MTTRNNAAQVAVKAAALPSATKTAALPTSLARLDKSCRSNEIRSTTASIAELINSTINTNKTLPTISARATPLTGK